LGGAFFSGGAFLGGPGWKNAVIAKKEGTGGRIA